jgi:hypothetical protein
MGNFFSFLIYINLKKNTNPFYWCKPNGEETIVKINIHADNPLLNFGFNVMQKDDDSCPSSCVNDRGEVSLLH